MINNTDKYPSIDLVATGRNIKQLRLDRNVKVSQLQNYLGFSEPQAIYKWERGESIPSTDHLVALAYYYKIKVDDIIVRKYTSNSSTLKRKKSPHKLDRIGFVDFVCYKH